MQDMHYMYVLLNCQSIEYIVVLYVRCTLNSWIKSQDHS